MAKGFIMPEKHCEQLGTDAGDTSLPDSRDAYRIFQPANVN